MKIELNEAERSVVGCVLLDGKSFTKVSLKPTDFSDESLRSIWNVFTELFYGETPIDLTTVSEALNTKGKLEEVSPEYLADLANYVPVSSHIEQYAAIVRENSSKRKITALCRKTMENVATEAELEKVLSETIRDFISIAQIKDVKPRSLKELSSLHQKEISSRNENASLYIGTGNDLIDEKTEGLLPSRFWILSGYSGSGKTTMALQMVRNFLRQNKRAIFYSLEMRGEDVVAVLERLRTFYKDNEKETQNWKLDIVTDKRSWFEISMDAQSYETKPDVILIDFAQIIGTQGRTEYERMQNLAHSIQKFCKQTDIPVILLSQISNDSARSSDGLYNAKGGGDLFAACDVFISIDRNIQKEWELKQEIFECRRNGNSERKQILERKLVIAKNRFGAETRQNIEYDYSSGRGLYSKF